MFCRVTKRKSEIHLPYRLTCPVCSGHFLQRCLPSRNLFGNTQVLFRLPGGHNAHLRTVPGGGGEKQMFKLLEKRKVGVLRRDRKQNICDNLKSSWEPVGVLTGGSSSVADTRRIDVSTGWVSSMMTAYRFGLNSGEYWFRVIVIVS